MQVAISTFVLFIVILTLILKFRIFKWSNIPDWLIATILSLKFAIIIAFVSVLNLFPQFDLKSDHTTFIKDSEVLANVFHEDKVEYFKLLTGIGATEEIQEKWLDETKLWFTPFTSFNDSRTVIRAHSLISVFPYQNEFTHLLIVTLISTLSLLFLVKTFEKKIVHRKIYFVFLSIGLPIFLIYGNLVLKEHILILGITLTCYGLSKKSVKSYHLWLGVFTLFFIKFYIFLALFISLVLYFILRLKKLKVKIVMGAIAIISFFLLFNSSFGDTITRKITLKQYAFRNVATQGLYLYDLKQRNHYYYLNIEDTIHFSKINSDQFEVMKDVDGFLIGDLNFPENKLFHFKKGEIYDAAALVKTSSKSYIEPLYINNQKHKLITFIPHAVYRGFLVPTLGSPGSIAKIPALLEVFWVIGIFIASLIFSLRKESKKWKSPLVITLFFFAIITAYIVGISTPVIGAIVRYRIPAYIALATISFLLIDSSWKRKQPLSQEQPQE